ncbi:MAG: hypothetical protein ITG02_11640 [Patulibacter sp.]|nr:hypothetical protein [Patulibacter sp.]
MSSSEERVTAEDLTWVRWNAHAAARHPEFHRAILRFHPLPHDAGRAAADWLRTSGLDGESVAYLALLIEPCELVGFYALTMGQVEIARSHRKRLDLDHPTQGAVLITQLARSAHHDFSGHILLEDAIGVATELAGQAGATAIALDPFNVATAAIWRDRFRFRTSRTALRARDDEGQPLKRLFLPLHDPRARPAHEE